MKVSAPLLAGAAAAFLVSCGEEEEVACVDQRTDRVADVQECDEDARDGYGGAFVWIYGASRVGRIGSPAPRGTVIDPANRRAIAQRGGFGSNAGGGGSRSTGRSGGFGGVGGAGS
jgi:hypothetical protein